VKTIFRNSICTDKYDKTAPHQFDEKGTEITSFIASLMTLAILLLFGIGIVAVKLHHNKVRHSSFFYIQTRYFLNYQKAALELPGVKKLLKGSVKNINPELSIEEQIEMLPYDKRWEFPRNRLKLGLFLIRITLKHKNN
jgi:hypothetical protein